MRSERENTIVKVIRWAGPRPGEEALRRDLRPAVALAEHCFGIEFCSARSEVLPHAREFVLFDLKVPEGSGGATLELRQQNARRNLTALIEFEFAAGVTDGPEQLAEAVLWAFGQMGYEVRVDYGSTAH